ncbi:MAG: DUF5106 domain-containing protein [Bacteroidales bacterium]|nr:DUF5106 domain-containing protein [Bacteroidales bacterium]
MKLLFRISFLAVLFFIAFSCSGKGNKESQKLPEFKPTSVPAPVVSEEEIFKYRVLHYWDDFPFDDIRCVRQEGYVERAFTNFAGLLIRADNRTAREGIRRMVSQMEAAGKTDSVQRQVVLAFNQMAELYFYHPNSPYRDEDLYLPILEYVVSSPFPDTLEKVRPIYLLELINKNKVGSPAADFHYIGAIKNLPHIPEPSHTKTLFSLSSRFTLLFFIHPDCSACMGATHELLASELITSMVKNKTLTILSLYPEEDREAWLQYLPNLPAEWLHAWNPESEIRNGNLYDLNAIPSLYLLDSNKRVLVKDALSIKQIEGVLREEAHFL